MISSTDLPHVGGGEVLQAGVQAGSKEDAVPLYHVTHTQLSSDLIPVNWGHTDQDQSSDETADIQWCKIWDEIGIGDIMYDTTVLTHYRYIIYLPN